MKPGDISGRVKNFNISDRLNSFRWALSGIKDLLISQHNSRIHLVALILVITAGFLLKISGTEWIAIIIVSGNVFICECLNSALEFLCDKITTETDLKIKRAKDLAAAAVLIAAIVSVITGTIIFLPKIVTLFK